MDFICQDCSCQWSCDCEDISATDCDCIEDCPECDGFEFEEE